MVMTHYLNLYFNLISINQDFTEASYLIDSSITRNFFFLSFKVTMIVKKLLNDLHQYSPINYQAPSRLLEELQ